MNKTETVIPDRVFKFNESVKKNNGTIEEKEVIDPKKITPKLKFRKYLNNLNSKS